MCGRYTLKTHRRKIEERFAVDDVPELLPRFNLGPTQDGLVVRPSEAPGTRTAALLRWGLIPTWTKAHGSLPLLINARAETVATKAAFREPFKRRRCLVVADGFYEWSRHGAGLKQPYHFTVDHGEPFAMAGLWERWRPPGAAPDEVIESYTIITTTANEVLAPYHDRMPVILEPPLFDDWLNPMLTDPESLSRMLQPFPALRMLARAVSHHVNNIKHDDPSCLDPPETAGGGTTGRGEPGGRKQKTSDTGGQMDLGL